LNARPCSPLFDVFDSAELDVVSQKSDAAVDLFGCDAVLKPVFHLADDLFVELAGPGLAFPEPPANRSLFDHASLLLFYPISSYIFRANRQSRRPGGVMEVNIRKVARGYIVYEPLPNRHEELSGDGMHACETLDVALKVAGDLFLSAGDLE
jgi:hypothetical protein